MPNRDFESKRRRDRKGRFAQKKHSPTAPLEACLEEEDSEPQDTGVGDTSLKGDWEGEIPLDGGIAIRLENPLRDRDSTTIWARFVGDGIPYGTELILSPEKAGEIGRRLSEVLDERQLPDRHRVVLYERGPTDDYLELRLAHHESLDLSYHEITGTGGGRYLLAYTVFDGGESDRYYFLADGATVATLAERFSAASETSGGAPSVG